MRTLLLHVSNGYSLRETVTRAKMYGLAKVTDVALLKRLQCSENWFKSLCMSLLKERAIDVDKSTHPTIQMRVVDGRPIGLFTTNPVVSRVGNKYQLHTDSSVSKYNKDGDIEDPNCCEAAVVKTCNLL